MALCPTCLGRQAVMVFDTVTGQPKVKPCPDCGGLAHTSCCDGPVGMACEMPSDPNMRNPNR